VIYAYELPGLPSHAGWLKIGYTTGDARKRVRQQLRTSAVKFHIVLEESAFRADGSSFTDHDVHRLLRKRNFHNPEGEWFACTVNDARAAVLALRDRRDLDLARNRDFAMRPEQAAAVEKTAAYFRDCAREKPGKAPHFLWNAKMRFGKTFAAYQLARRMHWRKLLVLTFKPAVQDAWEEDLLTHRDFEGWRFVRCKEQSLDSGDFAPNSPPLVAFGSFQDLLGKNSAGGIKAKNEWVHATNWDCVIFDEYHYGAWRENARELFEAEGGREARFGEGEGLEFFEGDIDEDDLPITTNAYLYLSGTPFRAIASGEFIEEQIYNWTYSDEQRAKAEWDAVGGANPYAALPRMVLLTYQLPEHLRAVASGGEFDEFDLSEFFTAEGAGAQARFKHEDEVQKWLDWIRDALRETTVANLKLRARKPPLPFANAQLRPLLAHTFWFLPSVASCHAMNHLLKRRQNTFYRDFNIVVAAGAGAGIGVEALPPVRAAMRDPLADKSITLSCGKLTTGVTVPPWSGIFMLRNTSSPETYFQAAFRVQSPWTVRNASGDSPNSEEIFKKECYVFDFAPNRALKQIADYSCRLDINETSPEAKVAEFIRFLPVLAYDGSSMKVIDAAGVLDIAMSGTTATLLARRWESALLVNVDDATLRRLKDNERAMAALMSIEGFRSLNQDIETIINKSEAVKKARREAGDDDLGKKEKKALSEEEKAYKSLRKKIQEKLIKFATRIPVFMYLTDYREECLRDVITQLEPGLFKKVTGLTVADFELLVSLNVFNSALMNDAVYKFRRYEDSSLEYTGVNRHAGEKTGLYDTVVAEG